MGEKNWFNFFIMAAVFIAIFGWFCWEECRPVSIRKDCAKEARQKNVCTILANTRSLETKVVPCSSRNQLDYVINERIYDQCLKRTKGMQIKFLCIL